MNGIGWAITMMQEGRAVCRAGWNGKGQWIELRNPDEDSMMTLPYVAIRTVQGDLVPWAASQTDLLATDWQISE